jgi:hypothetical protein
LTKLDRGVALIGTRSPVPEAASENGFVVLSVTVVICRNGYVTILAKVIGGVGIG